MSCNLPSSSKASLVMDKIALPFKKGASQHFLSCEFLLFEGLIQSKTQPGRMSEFISVSKSGTQILHTWRDEQGYALFGTRLEIEITSYPLETQCQ